nr:hypothetical protein [uncultured Draconibacterium sp.]
MKRSNQNIFMPFSIGGNFAFNQFANKRKTSLIVALSNSNRTVENMNFNREGSTQEADTDFYTTYDLDAENALFISKTKSDSKFIFNVSLVDTTNCSAQKPLFNEEKRIISTHWAELN